MNKKLYSFIICLLIGTTLSAQRQIDLKAAIFAPTPNANIMAQTPFTIKVVVRNISAFILDATDTIGLFAMVGTDTIPQNVPPFGILKYYPYTGTQLRPGDSLVLTMTHTFNNVARDTTVSLCVSAIPMTGNVASPIIDNNYADNHVCQNVVILKNHTGVGSTVKVGEGMVSVFPNPATGNVHFRITPQQPAEVSVTLTDLAGRVVGQSGSTLYPAGTAATISMVTNGLAAGIYLYQVKVGNALHTGKLAIQ